MQKTGFARGNGLDKIEQNYFSGFTERILVVIVSNQTGALQANTFSAPIFIKIAFYGAKHKIIYCLRNVKFSQKWLQVGQEHLVFVHADLLYLVPPFLVRQWQTMALLNRDIKESLFLAIYLAGGRETWKTNYLLRANRQYSQHTQQWIATPTNPPPESSIFFTSTNISVRLPRHLVHSSEPLSPRMTAFFL